MPHHRYYRVLTTFVFAGLVLVHGVSCSSQPREPQPVSGVTDAFHTVTLSEAVQRRALDDDLDAATEQSASDSAAPKNATPPVALSRSAAFGENRDSKWIELLVGLDPKLDAVEGAWNINENRLRLNSATPDGPSVARFTLPQRAELRYQIHINFTFDDDGGRVGLLVPVRGKTVRIGLGPEGTIDGIEDKPLRSPDAVTVPGRVHSLVLAAVCAKDKTTFAITLNGKPIALWSGSTESVAVGDAYRLPDPTVFGVYAVDTAVVFDTAYYRTLTEDQANTIVSAVPGDGSNGFFGIPID